MRWLLVCITLGMVSCQFSPVFGDSSGAYGERYLDCKGAAREYCKHVIDPTQSEMAGCVSKYTFECVSGIVD